jgi:beta-phosphoglucomutase-like phosphatase (HAD superfamily)
LTAIPRLPGLEVLLCDADGNLFPSEEPAFVASAGVTNRFLASLGVNAHYTAEELLSTTTGRNFRTTAVDLALAHGVPVEPALRTATAGAPRAASGSTTVATLTGSMLDTWVGEEKTVVTAYLGRVLRPDPAVLGPLHDLAEQYRLAAVSSSALSRLDTCFKATGLAGLLPAECRFSAEDSLPRPTSKPDPAVYRFALQRLGVRADEALAIEDSLPGAQSAIAAGIATVGNLMFVQPSERAERRAALAHAGVTAIVDSWAELAASLLRRTAGGAG